MVLDTSAIAAILLDEPERASFTRCISWAPAKLLSVVNRVELSCVIEGRKGDAGRRDLEQLLNEAGIDIVAVDRSHADLACDAFRRFGKGRHPAALNIGDCFAYALAKATGEPLLYKGNDFGRTDITSAA